MNLDAELNGKKFPTHLSKHDQGQEFTPEIFRQKYSDRDWLPSYYEIAKDLDMNVSHSFEDSLESLFSFSEKEDNKWLTFFKTNTGYQLFEIWTNEYIDQLADYLKEQAKVFGGTKENPIVVLEVGAGDGKLSYFLNKRLKEIKCNALKIVTTGYDKGIYHIKSKYNNVENLLYKKALEKYNPTIVICSWMMHGEDWTKDFRKIKSVREYILIGPEGPCGSDETWQRDWQTDLGDLQEVFPKEEKIQNWQICFYEKDGFTRLEQEELSELQICHLDLIFGSRKRLSGDSITKTTSFIRNKK